jgi:hypothetical protein
VGQDVPEVASFKEHSFDKARELQESLSPLGQIWVTYLNNSESPHLNQEDLREFSFRLKKPGGIHLLLRVIIS